MKVLIHLKSSNYFMVFSMQVIPAIENNEIGYYIDLNC